MPTHGQSVACDFEMKRMNRIRGIVLEAVKRRNEARKGPASAVQPVAEWCTALRANMIGECGGWTDEQNNLFKDMLKEKSEALRDYLDGEGGGAIEDAVGELTPVKDFVKKFHIAIGQLPYQPPVHPPALPPVSISRLAPRSPSFARHHQTQSPSPPLPPPPPAAASPEPPHPPLSSPSPEPVPADHERRAHPAYNRWRKHPNRDSIGQPILFDPYPELGQPPSQPSPSYEEHSHEEHSVSKPSVTDRAARRYGYRNSQHWRAEQSW